MKKYLWMITLITMSITQSVMGLTLDAVTSFSRTGSPSGKFYYRLNDQYTIMLGASASHPLSKQVGLDNGGKARTDFDMDLLLGVYTKMPLIGWSDWYLKINNYEGIQNSSHEGEFYIESFIISKKWLYTLNDRLKLGFEMQLAEFVISGTKQVKMLSSFSPVLAGSITF